MKPDPIHNLPDINSDDNHWMEWRESLNPYGKLQANLIFMEAWKTRSPDGNWFMQSKANTVRLRTYLEKKGIVLDKGLIDYTASFIDSLEDFFSSTFNIGKYMGIGAAAFVLLVLLLIVYLVLRNPEQISRIALSMIDKK